ncbi:MAG: exodeoxyribonuclease VII large subunit [Anaerolineae bacterium]
MQSPYTVEELNAHIRWMFERDDALQDLWVEGEVSGFKRAQPSGHCYFTLKGGKAQIDCAMWRSYAQQQAVLPKDGDAVLAHGYVNIYEERSKYQFYVDRIRPIGIGDLFYQFELLKAKLEGEGLFDPARKRPLPPFPHRIGVVTSPSAAAFQDVQNVLRRRFPLVEVLLSPTLVQGIEAPAQIVLALERLNARDDLDAILICRGGGSLEDLWAFNDENVARAIAASRVPVVSGVGHETDFTIADFAADVRAPTPSAAAELLTPDFDELRFGVERLTRDLNAMFAYSVGRRRDSLADQTRALRQLSPMARVRAYRQRIDDWQAHIASAHRGRLKLLRERVEAREGALRAANPQAILERGYALVTDTASGRRVTSAQDAVDRITVRFHDGAIGAKVEHD